jgi:hypothetical protein
MHIFSDKKSALLTITGCIVLLGVTLTVFNLLTNTATASHNNYEGTVTLNTKNQTGDSDTADDTGKIITADGQVWFRLMNVDESYDNGSIVFDQAKLNVESPDDPDSVYETGFFSVEGSERTIDGEDIELISVECSGTGCTATEGGFYWELEFGLIDDGADDGQCDPDETLEKEWTKLGDYGNCGDYYNGDGCNVPDSSNGSTGWASDSVPDCGETETYITSDGCSIGGTGSDMENCIFGGGTEQRTQQCNCVGGNNPPQPPMMTAQLMPVSVLTAAGS